MGREAGVDGPRNGQRTGAFLGRQPCISRRKRQAIGVADDGDDANFNGDVEIERAV
jgi:hypothetical protein